MLKCVHAINLVFIAEVDNSVVFIKKRLQIDH